MYAALYFSTLCITMWALYAYAEVRDCLAGAWARGVSWLKGQVLGCILLVSRTTPVCTVEDQEGR